MDQKRKRLIIGAVAALLFLAVTAAGLFYIYLSPKLRQGIESALSERTGRQVRLKKLTWALWPTVAFRGEGLTVGDGDGPPLAEVGEFDIQGGLGDLFADPRRLDSVTVRDLVVRLSGQTGRTEPKPTTGPTPSGGGVPGVVIGQVLIENLRLEIASTESGQAPQIFRFESVQLDSIDLRQSVPFEARLRYPKPAADLQVKGSFGPWNEADPTLTPFQGTFTFEGAELSEFQSVQGKLNADGTFEGSLREARVTGKADVSEFAVTGRGAPTDLNTEFQLALLDRAKRLALRQITARFLKSELRCQGDVSGLDDPRGPAAKLNVSGRQVQVEDLIRLATKGDQPPLTGRLEVDSTINVSPDGSQPLATGHFSIPEGRFTGVAIQETLTKISRIGGGQGEGEGGSSVVSNMAGDFVFRQGRLNFSHLEFGVPGAKLDLQGTYDLAGEGLDFQGKALLDLAPSALAPEKVSDWIKLVDPLLKGKKAGTSLPVRISGTRSRPLFWLDVARLGR